jgi:hypothetical protein
MLCSAVYVQRLQLTMSTFQYVYASWVLGPSARQCAPAAAGEASGGAAVVPQVELLTPQGLTNVGYTSASQPMHAKRGGAVQCNLHLTADEPQI